MPQPKAHSPNPAGESHLLADHTLGVAVLAGWFAGKFGHQLLGYLAGLHHDLGKISHRFQRYLENTKALTGGDHKGVGAALAARAVWQPLAFLIAGHHGGLPDKNKVRQLISSADPETISRADELLTSLHHESAHFDPATLQHLTPHQLELLIRMLFSALVDADFLDTERHFEPKKTKIRAKETTLEQLWLSFEKSQRKISGKSASLVNQERHKIYLQCLERADYEQGFFRLTVPTGGGKTRSAMAFALKHALRHKLDRVIVAIPYTSIIEQTADVYREIFGFDAVLEHHSSVAWRKQEDERGDGLSWARLASENWDAPIIVTTTVQLFESLFSNKTSRCRKLHSIANSILILDEVQTLPLGLLDPILDVLRQLVERYQVTVLLCTATQPAYEAHPYFADLKDLCEIVTGTDDLFQALKRVDYRFTDPDEPWDWERVATEMTRSSQALAILNTKKDALALLDSLPDGPETFHLSTLLCGAHRRQVIAEVKRRLQEGEPCRLVSTQVVEAGVDIDFPLVLRAVGPLDRIIQAAGRCNREGKLPTGEVIVFRPAESSGLPRGEYSSATNITKIVMRDPAFDPHHTDSVRKYFSKLFATVNTDKSNIQDTRRQFDYPEINRKFRIIESNTIPVVVLYKDEEEKILELIEKLRCSLPVKARYIMRYLQPFIVNVYENQLSTPEGLPTTTEMTPGLRVWEMEYDEKKGIVCAEPDKWVI